MNRDQWADALIAAMGWNAGVRDGIVAQAYSEGSRAIANPLDTTEPWPGSWPYNSVGVQNYRTTQDGLDATRATLNSGYYRAVISAGKVGDATAYVRAIAGSPWGTWSNTRDADNALAIVRGDPSLGQVEVVGTSPAPPEGEDDMTCIVEGGNLHVFGPDPTNGGRQTHWWQSLSGPDFTWHKEVLP